MAVLKSTTFGLSLTVMCGVICSLAQDDVYCPYHTQRIVHQKQPYSACEPNPCVPRDPDVSRSPRICPDRNQSEHFLNKMLSPSCHWARLYIGSGFKFNDNDDGSINELETNVTHHLGDYAYQLYLKEAYICREQLQADDDTEDITLWCSSHTIYTADYPDQLKDERGKYHLHLPHLNLKVPSGFYSLQVHKPGYKVGVCLKTSLEFMLCEPKITLQYSKTEFELLPNLDLLVNWTEPIVYPVGHYYLSADNGSAIVCIEPDKQLSQFEFYIYTLYIVSAVFLLFTVLVHLFYPKLNYHAKALLCCIVSMMVMYICLTFKRHYYHPGTIFGRFLLFGFYYVSSMSTYLWLGVLSYDLWKVFNNPFGSVYVADKKLWFAMKCVYAWGIPLALYFLIIGLSYDRTAAEYLGFNFVFGNNSFIMKNEGVFIFIYGPLIVILIANMVFCGLTIRNMRRASDQPSIIHDKDSLKLFYVSVRFFVVIGISWMADVISFLMSDYHAVFYVSDVINSLQGVAIFVVYVCRKSTWKTIRKRWTNDDTGSEIKSTKISKDVALRLMSVETAQSK